MNFIIKNGKSIQNRSTISEKENISFKSSSAVRMGIEWPINDQLSQNMVAIAFIFIA